MARHVLPALAAIVLLAALKPGLAVAAPDEALAGAAAPVLGAPVSVEAFLRRVRTPVAPAVPATPAHVPKTAHDNSPYRFDMTQNGRRMTAEEFEAWMKSRGIRVATGKPAGDAPAPASATGSPAAPSCTPSATTTC